MTLDISTRTPTQVVLNLAKKNQDELQKVSVQISSGNQYEDFKGLAEQAATENFLNFKSTINEIGAHVTSNNTAIARAKTIDSSMQTIQGLASDLAALITQRRNGSSGTDVPLGTETTGILDKIAGALNVQFDGRFMFSGSKTNTMPVTNIQTSNVNTSTTPPTGLATYYHGDNSIPSIRSSASEEVEYGTLGNDSGFKNLIAAAHLAISGHESNDDIKLGQALDMVNSAISQLSSTRALGLIAIDRLQKSNSIHQDTQLLVQENLDKISKTDIVAATAKMSELQAIVQAGYLAYSRLSSLQLTNYLK